MDTLNRENTFKLQRKPIKLCPSCKSVFITDVECESCGIQFNVDMLGDPQNNEPHITEKSYFGIKDEYRNNLSLLSKNYIYFENLNSLKCKSYLRKITLRLNYLLGEVPKRIRNKSIQTESLKFYEFEGIFILKELLYYRTDIDTIWSDITKHEDTFLGNVLSSWLIANGKNSERKKHRSDIFFKDKLFNVITPIKLLLSLGLTFSFIAMSLALAKYYWATR
jgi:hypothetical protein